jgi:hypothetical protein
MAWWRREHIVGVDESRRRVCWAVTDPPFEHYNGAAWVEPDINGGARFVWTADLLPHDLAAQVEENDGRRHRRGEENPRTGAPESGTVAESLNFRRDHRLRRLQPFSQGDVHDSSES